MRDPDWRSITWIYGFTLLPAVVSTSSIQSVPKQESQTNHGGNANVSQHSRGTNNLMREELPPKAHVERVGIGHDGPFLQQTKEPHTLVVRKSKGGSSLAARSMLELPGAGPRLHVMTYMDHVDNEFSYLLTSAEAHGIYPQSIGITGDVSPWGRNFGLKINSVRTFVNRDEIQDDDVVVFVDAFDVLILGNRDDILSKFFELERDTKKHLFFVTERVCFPELKDICNERYPKSKYPARYLNSGAFAGRASAIRRMLVDPVPDSLDHDQAWYHRYFLKEQQIVGLDTANVLLATWSDDMTVTGNAIHSNETDSNPKILHFPGPSHWHMFSLDARDTSAVNEAFRQLFPKPAEAFFDTIHLQFTQAGENFKLQVPSTSTHIFSVISAASFCILCNVFWYQGGECRSLPGLSAEPCSASLLKVSIVSTALATCALLVFRYVIPNRKRA